jgi:outer membrane protein assembly factor BamB
VLAGGRLIVVGGTGQALSLNPVTGETLNTQTLSDVPSPFAPVVADETMLVVTQDGRLTAWR